MRQEAYWTKLQRGRLSRRRILGATVASGAGLAGATLAGCGTTGRTGQSGESAGNQVTTQGAGTPQTGGTLNAYISANAPLDPQKVSASPQQAIGGVYSRLFRFKTGTDPNVITNHDLENDLGVSMESPDAITWTVRLRPDAKFHNIPPVNGHAVEAEDIKATFTRALDPAIPNPNRTSLGMIDPAQLQTPDKTTVVFKLKYAYAPFRKTMADPTLAWIYPREVLAGSYDPMKVAIGSGPFTLDSVTPDVANVYKKNPDWFDKPRPYVDSLRVAIMPDVSQQLAQFSAGNLDEVIPTATDLPTVKQRSPNAVVIKGQNASPNPLYLQLGDSTSAFKDIRVRRALSMALDRETLGKVVYDGDYQEMTFVPSSLGKWALQVKDLPPDIQKWYKYDPAEAKSLLAAAGQSDLQIRFVYLTGGITANSFGSPVYNKLADAIRNMLEAAGVKTTAMTQDYSKDYIDAGKGSRQGYFDKDMVILSGAAPFDDADGFIYNHFHSKSSSNAEHLKDPALDAMIDKERTIVNEAERFKAILEIERFLADKMYVVPSVGPYQYVMVQPRVRNYQYSNSLGKMTETFSSLWLKG